MLQDFDRAITEKEGELEELKRQRARFEKLRPDQKIAEALHSRMCTHNHDDQCGWGYESWEKPGGVHNDYLKKAQAMLQIADDDEMILQLIKVM